mgnify:CR=1 FL=1
MKKYIYPKMQVTMFSDECVAMTASVMTYEEWAEQQMVIEAMERRFTALNEITKFKF